MATLALDQSLFLFNGDPAPGPFAQGGKPRMPMALHGATALRAEAVDGAVVLKSTEDFVPR